MKAELNLSILLILAQVSFCKNNPVISSSLLRWETGWPTETGTRRRSTRLRRLSWWYMYWVRLESSWVLVGWLFGSCWSILLKCKEWIFFFFFILRVLSPLPSVLCWTFWYTYSLTFLLRLFIFLTLEIIFTCIYKLDFFIFLKLRYAVTVTVHLLEFT